MTSPVISWPRTMWPPGRDVLPRTMCWSLPQMFVLTTLRMTPWLHFLFWRSDTTGLDVLSSSNFGKGMSCGQCEQHRVRLVCVLCGWTANLKVAIFSSYLDLNVIGTHEDNAAVSSGRG